MDIAVVVDRETVKRDGTLRADANAERDVCGALRELGHQIRVWPLALSVSETLSEVRWWEADLVFNLTEHYQGDRDRDHFFATLLEHYRFPFTGASSAALSLCRDKEASKRIVEAAGIAVPKTYLWTPERDDWASRVPWPLIIKPLRGDGSEHISRKSVVGNSHQAQKRAQSVWRHTRQAVLAEQYIDGTEYTITVTGSVEGTPKVWGVSVLNRPKRAGDPYLYAHEVKNGTNLKRHHGNDYVACDPISQPEAGAVAADAANCFATLRLDGYARFDFRVLDGRCYFLEANPNSNLNRDSDATQFRRFGHTGFVEEVVRLGLERAQMTAKR